MRLQTVRIDGGERAARDDGDALTLLPFRDVGEALASSPDWRSDLATIAGPQLAAEDAELAPVVPRPEKIIGVGLNYRSHALEARLPVPDYPPLFAKFWRSLLGARDPIALPRNSDAVDWEVELAIVVGREVRHCSEDEALEAIAGFTIMNDVSMRDWQLRTSEFLQGKTFEASAPFGPCLVTLDELEDPHALRLTCELDGVVTQDASSADMLVQPAQLISYISQVITLVPGDVIATGTPGGVGGAMDPPRFLADGETLRTAIAGIGELVNVCVAERAEATVDAGKAGA